MNKRGITFFFTLMLGITIIVLGLALAKPTKDFVDTTRTDMNCTSTDISLYDQAACVGYDALKPLISGGMILIGVAVMGAKILWGT